MSRDLYKVYTALNKKISDLEAKLKEAETVIKVYSNPDDLYWVEKSDIVDGVRIFYIKDIQQLSFMAKQYFKKGKHEH